jgi:hypothetical protein
MPASSLILLIVGIVVISYVWFFIKRSQARLQSWAIELGYTILHAEMRFLRRGPFLWSSSKNQVVYRIKVRDAEARERWGWICLGDYWVGIFSDPVATKWDE